MENIYKFHLREDELDVVILSLKAWTNVGRAADVLARAEQLKQYIKTQRKAEAAKDSYYRGIDIARHKDRSTELPFDE